MTEPKPMIVASRKPYVRYLIERCGLPADVEVRRTVGPDDIRGRHVYGMLPPYLAQYADRVSTLATRGPSWIRPKEMTLDQLRRYGAEILTYRVECISEEPTPLRR